MRVDFARSILIPLLALMVFAFAHGQGTASLVETRDVWNGQLGTYTLSTQPVGRAGPKVFRNGMLLQPYVDYSLNGRALTFSTVQTPVPGDVVQAIYWAVN